MPTRWPPLSYEAWSATCDTLHAHTQVLGKLAVELAPDIRVNAASCGLIDGEVADQFPRAAQMRELTAAATPLGRVATPDDLANVVLFLASDAARYMCGALVEINGGKPVS